jgi:thioredoxin reductase (NADPH)
MHEEGKMDCNEIAKTQALANSKMEFVWNTVVESFEGAERLDTVMLKNLKTQELLPYKVDSCFLFIGYLPNTELFNGMLDMNRGGYLLTNEKMETNVPGVFAVGDIRDKFLKQVATAVGDGAIAGYAAERYIAEDEIYESQILNEGKASVVYLYNAADSICREILPIIDTFKSKHGNRIGVTKIDTYKSDGIAKKLGISTCPCVVCIDQNKVVKVIDNSITLQALEAAISF